MGIALRWVPLGLMGICGALAVEACFATDAFVNGTACTSDADCEILSACERAACVAHVCKTAFLPSGTALPDTKKGDCHRPACDGKGGIMEVPDTSDVPASTSPCTKGACSARGHVESSFVTAETACIDNNAKGVCDGNGACVECVQAADCPGSSTPYCFDHACASCSDGTQNGDETGVDCGGSHCKNCNGEACTQPSDCASMDCAGGSNGDKCGWPANVPCTQNEQCASLKCMAGVCTAP